MIKIPKTPPCYLTTNQLEKCSGADHTPCNPHPNVAFKNPCLRATGEFGSFEHHLPVPLVWCPEMNAVIPFTTIRYQETGFARCPAGGPKFGSVTTKTSYLGIDVEITKFIPNEFYGLVQCVKITNTTSRARKLRVFNTESINIGDARGLQFSGFNSMMMAGGYWDKELDGFVWRNNYGIPFDCDEDKIKGLFGKVLVHISSEKKSTYSSRYKDFVGHYTNTMANPTGVLADKLAETSSEEMCSALSVLANDIELAAGETKELVFALVAVSTEDYYCNNKKEIKNAMKLISTPEKARKLYEEVSKDWNDELDKLQFYLGISLQALALCLDKAHKLV